MTLKEELTLLSEIEEISKLKCPMFLVCLKRNGKEVSNCPLGHENCSCKLSKEEIEVGVK